MENLVSIIIPTYKRSDLLPQAINSVLNQTYKNIEVIVVDDNNPETTYRKETELTMKKYLLDDKVRYIKHSKNKNGSAARNTGYRHSNGDYIMFLDDDDEFSSEKIEKQLKTMQSLDSSWGASYCGYIRKKNGKTIIKSAEKREGNLLTQELMRNLFVHAGSNLMIRKSVIEDIGGFDESFYRNQDVEFLCRLLKKYKLAYVDTVGLTVNVDDKKNKNAVDFIELTNQYIEKFNSEIQSLTKEEQKKVYIMINLQIVRYHLTRRKIKKAFRFIKNKRLNLFTVIRYILYLITRSINKKAYGFNI